jgi:pyrroline-5-carboxylate reductase
LAAVYLENETMRNVNVGFIGFGRMGSLIAERALKTGRLNKKKTIAFAPSAATRKRIKRLGVVSAGSAAEVVRSSSYIWLCVKPQKMSEAIASFAGVSVTGKCFVSIAAGVPTEQIEKWLGLGASVIRVMPNTPSLLGAGMSALSRGKRARAPQATFVADILSSMGDCVLVPEKWMHAVTAVSGSGPAYIFYMAEAMVAAAQTLGLDKKTAERLVRQTIFGAGRMLKETGVDAAELRTQVTSPGGTTAAALSEFERQPFRRIVADALKKAVKRSKELSRLK